MERGSRALVLLVFFAAMVFCGPISFAAQGSSSPPPLRVVVVSGSNYEMGVQYGEQAADLIAATRDAVWNAMETEVYDTNGKLATQALLLSDIQVWTYYLEKYDPKLKDWLIGISDGCKHNGFNVSYVDLVAIMVHPQEIWARPAMPYPPETGVKWTASLSVKGSKLLAKGRTDTTRMSSCTSFAATGTATEGGVPMVSITGGGIDQTTAFVILVAFPTDGNQFISLTTAGRVATNFGMNSEFGWTMPAAVTAPWSTCPSSWGVTSEVYFHYLQQYCRSPWDAVRYLNQTPKGGVTGLFVFADKSGEVFIDECGSCGCVIRKPGDLGENKAFVATTNDYNSPQMAPYNLGALYFPDTFFRYATIFQELSSSPRGTIGRNFAEAAWLSDSWYDATAKAWNTVPCPDNPNDPNTCNVPANLCEGGQYQMISFPSRETVYLEFGDPQGTAFPPSCAGISAYWPSNPQPTGQYTKWQLSDSVVTMAARASEYAQDMIQAAEQRCWSSNPSTSCRLLYQANNAYQNGLAKQAAAERAASDTKAQMALWGQAYTDYVTAQLYAQMAYAQLKQ